MTGNQPRVDGPQPRGTAGTPRLPDAARQVVEGQVRLAERLSVELAANVLAHADEALRHLGGLRRAMGDAAAPAALDASAGIEAALMALLAEAQRQDTLRQVLEGVSALAAVAVDCDVVGSDRSAALLERFADIGETYVTEDQRAAHSAALGRGAEPSGPTLELF